MRRPRCCCDATLAEQVIGQDVDQSGVFRDGNEPVFGNEHAVGFPPLRFELEACDLAGNELHDGEEGWLDHACINCRAQLPLDVGTLPYPGVHDRLEEAKRRSFLRFGTIESDVGFADSFF